MVRLEVFRWAPGEREQIRSYDVQTVADTTVLDALVAIQREQDPTIAFRLLTMPISLSSLRVAR